MLDSSIQAGSTPLTSPLWHPGDEEAGFVPFGSDQFEQSIPQRFEQIVKRHGSRIAVDSNGSTLTYTQLNNQANRVAHAILDQLGNDSQPVTLMVDQGRPLVCAIFATLKAGKHFIALDPTYPGPRNAYMFTDSQAKLILTDHRNASLANALADKPKQVINIDQLDSALGQSNPELRGSPDQLAYILYTSGSTGSPKGVLHNHSNVLHNVMVHTNAFKISPADRQTLVYPCSVYGGIRDIFNTLLNGAGLYHYPLKQLGLGELAKWIDDKQITIYCSVATVFRYFARCLSRQDLFPHLRLIKLGGEAPYQQDVELYRQYFADNCILFCGLGSTETGMTRQFPIDKQTPIEGPGVPLGYPVDGMEVLILDENDQPVGFDQVGQIAIRSRFVALGYHGQEELTKKAFHPDPHDPQKRIYLSGDLGVMHPDGCLEHRGRKDFQVKIRGNRIEIGEIETALRAHEVIEDAAVAAGEDDRGETQLVAYLVAKEVPPQADSFREYLEGKLPDYMVPAAYITLTQMPLTPNGKLDRKALPDSNKVLANRTATRTNVAPPQNDIQRRLVEIFEQVLGVATVGIDESFFDLGGHSLLAVDLVTHIERQLGQAIPLASLLSAPTVAQLAKVIDGQVVNQIDLDVVCFRAEGSRPPLFALPGRGGTVFCYRQLSQKLGPNQPFYGLQLPSLKANEEPIEDIRVLAGLLIERMGKTHPSGPYYLIGYSFGGLLAYEMAQQLSEQGQAVLFLGLLDTTAPGSRRPRPLIQRLGIHLETFKQRNTPGKLKYVKEKIVRLWQRLSGCERRAIPLVHYDPDSPLTQSLQRINIASVRAMDRYVPEPYAGNAVLLQSQNRPQWLDYCETNPLMGWGELIRGGVDMYQVPGGHLDMLAPEHIPELASTLSRELDKLQPASKKTA